MDSSSEESRDNIKSRSIDKFRKQQHAAQLESIKIRKRLDKTRSYSKQQNLAAKKTEIKLGITDSLAERFQVLTIEENTLQDLKHDFELNGPYDLSTSDDGSYFSSGFEDELSDSDYQPHSQEFSDSYDYSQDDQSEHSSSESEHSEEDDMRLLQPIPYYQVDEKDVCKNKNHKNHLSHQKDKQKNLEKKLLTFAFNGFSKKGVYHNKTIYNIGRLEKHIFSSYLEENNPTEVAEQPKERAQDIKKCNKK